MHCNLALHAEYIPHRALKTAVVVCNKSNNMPLGSSLVKKLISNAGKSERWCQDIYWLVCDVFHGLNHWTSILETTRMQLKIEIFSSDSAHPKYTD